MRCPYCRQKFIVQGPFCPKCGRRIFGAEARAPDSQGQAARLPTAPAGTEPPSTTGGDWSVSASTPEGEAGGDVLEITLEEPDVRSPQVPAEAVGKICPYCRFPIKEGEDVIVCSECKVPHHRECWEENGGCTTYGCRNAPGAIGAGASTQAAYGGGAGGINEMMTQVLAAEVDRSATHALLFSILGIIPCCLPSVIGFFWGLVVLSTIRRMGLYAPKAQGKAVAAMVLGIVLPLIALSIFTNLASGISYY